MLFVLCALGCFAPPQYSSSPGYAAGTGSEDYGAYGGGSGGDYRWEYDEQVADKKAEAEYVAEEAKQQPARDTPVMTPTSEVTTTDTVTQTEPPPAPEPDPSSPAPSHGRQIIYTAGMGLSVFDVDDVMNELEAIPERHGGWLHQRYDNSVVLRVPAAKLELIIDEVSEWGVVEWKTLSALDVTAEYTDLDSRIRVLEQMQKHLQELLAKAQNVEQALEIQVELSRISAELEQLRAQMRLLESSIAFSTLAVELRERGTAEVEPSDDPFPWVDELGAEATAYR